MMDVMYFFPDETEFEPVNLREVPPRPGDVVYFRHLTSYVKDVARNTYADRKYVVDQVHRVVTFSAGPPLPIDSYKLTVGDEERPVDDILKEILCRLENIENNRTMVELPNPHAGAKVIHVSSRVEVHLIEPEDA